MNCPTSRFAYYHKFAHFLWNLTTQTIQTTDLKLFSIETFILQTTSYINVLSTIVLRFDSLRRILHEQMHV